MKISKKLITIAIHIISWLLLVSFSLLLDRDNPFHSDLASSLMLISLYAILFYSTYFGLMPLLFGKKMGWFITLTILILGITGIAKQEIIGYRMEKNFIHSMENYPLDMSFDEFSNMDKNSKVNRPPNRQPGFNPNDRSTFKRKIFNRHMLIDFSSLFLFYVLGFALRFIEKWQDDEKWKSEMEQQKVKTELQYLKQQINPHFLFNSLNSIYSLALTKSEQTTYSILKLSSILRYMLYESEDSMVSLKNELSTVKDYIDLHRLRLTQLVDVQFHTKGEAGGYKIAPFILIPLIENAFKYGADSANHSFIHININIEPSYFTMVVENKIITTEKDKNSSGIGLKNIQRRLELLYPGDHEFNIQKEDGKYKVTLQLKLRS